MPHRSFTVAAIFSATLAGCFDDPCTKVGIICGFAGTGVRGFNGDGKPALASDLYLASQARKGPDGRVYVMDYNNHRLRVVDNRGVFQTVAGNGEHALAVAGPALDSPLENPLDFDFAADGRIYLTPLHDPRLVAFTLGGRLDIVAGTGTMGDDGDGGPAMSATLTELTGVVAAPNGNVFISDGAMHRVRVIYPGGVIARVTTGALDRPEGLALDAAGQLYVADSMAHRVFRVDPASGAITTIAGTGVAGGAGDGGLATEAQLSFPAGVALDEEGRVYICDTQNQRIRVVALDGTISTLAGDGAPGHSGDGGPAIRAALSSPSRITISDGTMYIADQVSSVIRTIRLR